MWTLASCRHTQCGYGIYGLSIGPPEASSRGGRVICHAAIANNEQKFFKHAPENSFGGVRIADRVRKTVQKWEISEISVSSQDAESPLRQSQPVYVSRQSKAARAVNPNFRVILLLIQPLTRGWGCGLTPCLPHPSVSVGKPPPPPINRATRSRSP